MIQMSILKSYDFAAALFSHDLVQKTLTISYAIGKSGFIIKCWTLGGAIFYDLDKSQLHCSDNR